MIYPNNFERKLGFDEIRKLLKARCQSTLGQEKVDEMTFSTDAAEVNEWLAQVREFRRMREEHDDFPMQYFFDVRECIARIRLENTHLEEDEVWDLRRSLETLVNIVRYLERGAEETAQGDVKYPKKEDGTPKYEFTEEKPEGSKAARGTFYLETDNAIIGFSTSTFVYQTSVYYKQKFGDQKGTFDDYLSWVDDKDSKIHLSGMEKIEINGRKALRYYNREGSSGNYKFYGYSYAIGVDDIYSGSRLEMGVFYKTEESEAKEFDEETLSIINSLKVEQNQ